MLQNLFKSVETKSLFRSSLPITTPRLSLRNKTIHDLYNDYRWANDPALCQLNATPPLQMNLAEYTILYEYNLRVPRKSSAKLAIDMDGNHIGNCMLYNIDSGDKSAEYGIMIGDSYYRRRGIGVEATHAFVDYVFTNTPIQHLYLHTLVDNLSAKRCFLKAGFQAQGETWRDGYNFCFMALSSAKY